MGTKCVIVNAHFVILYVYDCLKCYLCIFFDYSKVHGTVILLGFKSNIINSIIMILYSVALWRNNVNVITLPR